MDNKRETKSITRKQYSAEFIAEAVRLVTSGERSQAEVARNLGIGSATISKWVQAAKVTRNPAADKAESAEVRELKAEIKRLKLEKGHFKKGRGVLCKEPDVKYEFIETHRMEFPVIVMCRVLEVSTSGYYQWRKDVSSQREADDERLIDLIKVLHAESYGGYGTRRIVRGLKQQGILVNIKRIRRLMRQIGIKGKGTPKKFVTTTDSNHDNPVADNHLARRFTVDVPNTKWVSDITYIWTEEGWLYLAVVVDLFNRMVVGWATSAKINANLVCLALQRAISRRKPSPGLLLHSDRGVQYTSESYRQLAKDCSITQSMSRLGNCWDNAVAESFFRSLKVEAITGYKLQTRLEA